jgi:nucleotide-binding universal stress UspA family protein
MVTFKCILYPTDFSQASAKALSYACDLARTFGAELHVLHVVQDSFPPSWTADAYGCDLTGLRTALVRNATSELARIAAGTGLRPLTACRVGRPCDEIVAYAREIGADLIVMGSHGHGPVAQFILGSVAERTVRHASCPVLTIKEPRKTVPELATDNLTETGRTVESVA